jgi:HAD superfamily hydrolase (TIGR01509 family)
MRAVLFDLDGTLLPIDFDRFLARFLERLGAGYRAVGLEIVGPAMRAVERMLANGGARTNADVFWSETAALVGREREALEARYRQLVLAEASSLGEGIAPDPVARAVVEACRAGGRRVALATNPVFSREMIDARARWAGLDPDGFDLVTCYERMRSCKPRVEYYLQVAAELGVAPADCVMVGNDVALDLEPAAAAGMLTCLVSGPFTVGAERGFIPDVTCGLAGVPAWIEALQPGQRRRSAPSISSSGGTRSSSVAVTARAAASRPIPQ